jgi:hypothetical protein
MLRIEWSSNEKSVLLLSGRIEIEDVAELKRLLSLERVGQVIALDLQNVTLIDRDAVGFLAHCEMENMRLDNCPAYIREWIIAERAHTAGKRSGRLDRGPG